MGLSSLWTAALRPRRIGEPPAPPPPPVPLPRRSLAYPLEPPPRIALFGPHFVSPGPTRHFTSLDWLEIERFQPETIAAPWSVFRQILDQHPIRRLPTLRRPLLVFSELSSGLLEPADRDVLWQAFGLPLFEQWRGWDGELLASECEAHEGLHVHIDQCSFDSEQGLLLVSSFAGLLAETHHFPTGYSGRMLSSRCPCGSPLPRLVDLKAAFARLPG
jgi:hypothetical protein